MKRKMVLIVVGLGLLLMATTLFAGGRMHGVRKPAGEATPAPSELAAKLSVTYTVEQMNEGVYVGSEYCMACHTWSTALRDTKHMQALRRPMGMYSLIPGKGVVADHDSNGMDDFMQGLDLNQISSAFDKFKPNAPILSYDAASDTYWMQIGQLKMRVVATQGGTIEYGKQRYLLKVPVNDLSSGVAVDNYVSPVQYQVETKEYVLYTTGSWYDSANLPKINPGMTSASVASANGSKYNQKCIGCHTTGTRELKKLDSGEYSYKAFPATLYAADDPAYFDWDGDGIYDLVNVGCEACHGPGSAHILGAGDPNKIVAPSKLSPAEQNDVCEQCHGRYKSLPAGTHDWPIKDDTYEVWLPGSGKPLTDFVTDAAGLWPDGKHSKQHHQQNRDFEQSSKPGFVFHPVVCSECHSPHSRRNSRQIRTSITDGDLRIPTRDQNDTLCLACHATHGPFEALTKEMIAAYDENIVEISRVVSSHTFHPFAPDRTMGLSRCSLCHMPGTAVTAIAGDIKSHTFEVIAPEKTLLYQEQGGMPNACAASCHGVEVNLFGLGIDPKYGTWNEEFDTKNAEALKKFFGPGGIWWDTDHAKSATGKALAVTAAPGSVPPPADPDN